MSQDMEDFFTDFNVFCNIGRAKIDIEGLKGYNIEALIALYGIYKNQGLKKRYFSSGSNDNPASEKQKKLIRELNIVGSKVSEDELDKLTVSQASKLINENKNW